MVVHAWNLSYVGSRDTIMAWSQPGQKVGRPYLKNKPGVLVHASDPSYEGKKT
jgi:hypothetical protein